MLYREGLETGAEASQRDSLVVFFWGDRLFIGVFVLAVLLLAGLYAFLSAPVYEARGGTLPPSVADVSSYNVGRTDAGFPALKPADVYEVFTRMLSAGVVKREFFQSVYLPSLGDAANRRSQDDLWSDFMKVVVVRMPDPKGRAGYFEVKVEGKSPEQAVDWVNAYVSRASELAKSEILQNLQQDNATRIKDIERRIDVLRQAAVKRREDRIVRLQEALVTAKQVSNSVPQVSLGRTAGDGDISAFLDGSMVYLRGSKAIESELQLLQSRKSDDPFIPELRELQSQVRFLQDSSATLTREGNVFSWESRAELPEEPVRPKVLLIMMVAGVVSLVFAGLASWARFVLSTLKVK